MGERQENKMGVMPVGRLVLSMSWPAILSMMIQALYNVVDSIFVAHISENALAAITLIFPVQMLMISVGVGTGLGINSLIARRLGEKRFEEADLAASNGFRLGVVNWIIFAVLGLLFAEKFMGIFSNNKEIISGGTSYLTIVTAGCIFMMMTIVIEKIIQATGNMVMPMLAAVGGAVTNIILDPILIFGLAGAPKMGISGAAVATVIGQAVSMIINIFVLFRGDHIVTVTMKGKLFDMRILKEIYAVGVPSMIMQAIASIMQFGMNMILAGFSTTAVAVMGVYGRLQSFVFMPVFGINQGAMPVIGYNFGAREKQRLVKAFRVAFMMSFTVMTAGFILFQLLPSQLLSVFDASSSMYAMGIPALRIISICFFPASLGIIAGGAFGATAHGFISLAGSTIRQLVGILPLAFIFGRIGGVNMIWWAFPAAEVFGLTYSIVMLRYIYKKEIMHLDEAGNGRSCSGDIPADEAENGRSSTR